MFFENTRKRNGQQEPRRRSKSCSNAKQNASAADVTTPLTATDTGYDADSDYDASSDQDILSPKTGRRFPRDSR